MVTEQSKPLILVVDDIETGRYATTRVLQANGFDVLEAASGEEALEKAQELPDLIILDINMPDISGFEVCKRLKADPATSAIPVLHLSATYLDTESKVTGLEGGADGYLTQPVDPKELTATINALLRIKKAEEAAERQARQWQTTFDAASDAIWVLDGEERIVQSNRTAERFFKKSRQKLIGRHCWEIVHATSEPIPECPTLRVKQSLGRESMELPLEGRWFEVSVDPILNDEGSYAGAVHIVSDITERKQAEEALRNSEERAKKQRAAIAELVLDESLVKGETAAALNKITTVTADAFDVERSSIWALDESGDELKCLSLYEARTGTLSSGAVLQAKIISRYFAAIKEENRISVEHAREDPRTSKLTENYLKPLGITSMLDAGIVIDGEVKGVICLEHVGSPRLWQADEEAFASTIASIAAQLFIADERKILLETLKQSEEKYRYLAENLTDVIWTVDLEGNLTYISPVIEELIGFTPEEVMAMAIRDYVVQEDYDAMMALLSEELAKSPAERKRFASIQARYRTKDNRLVHVELNSSWILDEQGNAAGVQGTTRDITDRKKYEAKLKYMSFHDQLTGLYNRHFLEEEMKRLDTERQLPISIIMADLNGLKMVNDTYSYQTGDEMLKRAAEVLKNACREEDIIARFGGDEFVLYLPRTPENEALKICSRIEQACRQEQGSDVPLSLSTGMAVKVSAEQKLNNLLKEAEDKMYQNKLTESRSGKSAIVNTLLKTLEAKSFETEAHTRNMQEAAQRIGEKLGLPDSELRRLDLLITLHDIGKINVPGELLNKKEALTDTEWAIMKKHCEIGFRIARATDDFAHVADDILAHHERWDGSGYPRGLIGEEIPLLSRITAIADAFEVMSNGRPYKKAMSKNEIVAEFKRCAGTQFDPKLVEIFLSTLQADG